MMLPGVEEAFRNLKSHLGLRPNFHKKRIELMAIFLFRYLHTIYIRQSSTPYVKTEIIQDGLQ